MLPCERPHNVSPLSPADRDRAATGFIADVCTVIHEVLRDEANYPNTRSMRALLDSLRRREFPDLHILNTVVGWTIFTLERLPHRDGLTDEQRAILAAAWRISDSLHGPRSLC